MENHEQAEEITVLESIYTDEEFSYQKDENGCYRCNFRVSVTVPKDYYLTYKDLRQPDEEPRKVQISHLPPLTLEVTLPEDYPSNSAPKFKLTSSWLPLVELSKLCSKLDEIWEENKGMQILFTWADFLMQETLAHLCIGRCLRIDCILKQSIEDAKIKSQEGGERKSAVKMFHDPRAAWDSTSGRNPVQLLIDYNKRQAQIEFEKNFHNCKICFTETLGKNCTRFSPCGHIFCKDCISNYLQVRIKEGTVQNICCPEEKCTSEINPGQVKSLISSDLFNKYDSVLLNATLDTMTDIIYCPRRKCQYPVIRESNGPKELAQCPNCQFAFCIYCKSGYHGIEPCKITSGERQKLVNEYQNASEEGKLLMEQRYGKKKLQELIDLSMSEDWLNSNTNKCPQCDSPIEKSEGCNKMTCWKCNTYFCWLCRKVLNSLSPYAHYDDPDSKCYGMLNYRITVNEDGQPISDEEEEEEDDDLRFYMAQDVELGLEINDAGYFPPYVFGLY